MLKNFEVDAQSLCSPEFNLHEEKLISHLFYDVLSGGDES
jgi:hypothetical protein